VKKLRNIVIITLSVLLTTIIVICTYYNYNISPVGKNKNNIEITIPKGTSRKGIVKILKENKLIRNEKCFLIYLKLNNIVSMKAGYYDLNQSMNAKEITNILIKGSTKNPNAIQITFKEGINIKKVAQIISENTTNSYDDVINKVKNQEYLDKLIEKYWFIDESVKNKELYYPLEGYLFPDTYRFEEKNVSVEEIIETMLNEMDKILTPYKEEMVKKNLSVNQVITLASIIEKEGRKKDFKTISSVFNNRIKIKMALQSCATAYYGMGLEFNELGIATAEVVSATNPYNTYRITTLPIGPIALPSKDALDAAVFPNDTEYLYFLSDNQKVTYFFKTYAEHQNKQQELINTGKWYR